MERVRLSIALKVVIAAREDYTKLWMCQEQNNNNEYITHKQTKETSLDVFVKLFEFNDVVGGMRTPPAVSVRVMSCTTVLPVHHCNGESAGKQVGLCCAGDV